MSKNYLKTVVFQVYKNHDDKELGIPPLFNFQTEITDIDETRIDASNIRITANYEPKNRTK